MNAATATAPSTVFDEARLVRGHGFLSRPIDAQSVELQVFYSSGGATTVGRGENAWTIPDGAFLILPGADPISFDAPDCLLVVALLSEVVAVHRESLRAAIGRVHPTTTGTASLLGHLFDGIVKGCLESDRVPFVRLAQHICGLLGFYCADARWEVDQRDLLLIRAKAFIEDSLVDAELSPVAVASAVNVSIRTLNRAFEAQELTVGGWIRERRLAQCGIDLSDERMARVPVSSVGCKWGFWDAAHFSRLFKAHFGQTPRAYRRAALEQAC